ncbi:MAG TPA: DUF433 domain-containing protein [Chitinophagales bacterium]|nr:DUF433 domain-containing protein [Chitinophagales bacterium]HNB49845.1 DUF433 domain-containing protein [Chitinophagales bacterium]HNG71848.1 DUF433 domain-containing protein [Chitinophagales bacterium]HNI31419.1 DUF433 domain-containing protein [Chitinophagales bacterium]HNK11742.1 DUF433 domain-containing protein [Chitinophagales bacterium]
MDWLASDMSIEEIIEDFPQLNKQQILACVAFAAEKERKLKVSA